MSDTDSIPYEKNGWVGTVSDYLGPSVIKGLLVIHAKKDSRVIIADKLTAEQVAIFDPDLYWTDGIKFPTTAKGRALKENRA